MLEGKKERRKERRWRKEEIDGGRRKKKEEEKGEEKRKKKKEKRRKKKEENKNNLRMHHLSHQFTEPTFQLIYLWPKNPNTAPICPNPAFKKSFLTNAGGTNGMNNPPNKGVS
jgi:hypothetical protein